MIYFVVNKPLFKDTLIWGFLLWFVGYILGIVLFTLVPPPFLGWVIMPFGISITLWVLIKKIKRHSFNYYLSLAITWTLLAIIFDYFFLVKIYKPADGYYKLDVYLYYILTFILPLIVWWIKKKKK